MEIKELKQGQLVQENSTLGRTLYKVSTLYQNHATLQFVYQVLRDGQTYMPQRTSVYHFSADEIGGVVPASAQLINAWVDHLDGQRLG
jgi:hypothetical protein